MLKTSNSRLWKFLKLPIQKKYSSKLGGIPFPIIYPQPPFKNISSIMRSRIFLAWQLEGVAVTEALAKPNRELSPAEFDGLHPAHWASTELPSTGWYQANLEQCPSETSILYQLLLPQPKKNSLKIIFRHLKVFFGYPDSQVTLLLLWTFVNCSKLLQWKLKAPRKKDPKSKSDLWILGEYVSRSHHPAEVFRIATFQKYPCTTWNDLEDDGELWMG